MKRWVDEIPPLQQAMRYGNKAFRSWHARLVRELLPICTDLTSGIASAQGAHIELAAYLVDAFGNSTRIDYGTGHETCFMLFLYCACKCGMLPKEDLPGIGLSIFPAYLDVCRKLQRTYWLEPAGSHGVWSLDDYQFLVFLFGSAQLLNHRNIKPRSIHSREVLEGYAQDFMYLQAVSFINDVKSGAPFAEHSPILNDIGELPHWGKVNEGLAKMYKAEVLGKLPVVQHFVFGSLLQATWTPSREPTPSDSTAHLYAHMAVLEAGGSEAAALAAESSVLSPPGADQIPVDHSVMATAPWATQPLCLHKNQPHQCEPCRAAGPGVDLAITGVAPWAVGAGGAGGSGLGARPGAGDASLSASGSSFHSAFPGLKHMHAVRSPGAGSPGHVAGGPGRFPTHASHASGESPSSASQGLQRTSKADTEQPTGQSSGGVSSAQ